MVLLRARDCQRKAAGHRILIPLVSLRRSRASSVVVAEAADLDSRRSMMLALCLVELVASSRICQLLRSEEVL